MQKPNILLITTDQQRHDALGINGNKVLRTPNLDSWASSGTNFTRAYTTCPSCIAARRSILTGLHPSNPLHGLRGYRDGLEFNPPWTLPALMRDAGYQTQLIGKLHQYPQRKRFGFDNIILSEQMDIRADSKFFGVNDYGEFLQRNGHKFLPNSVGIGPNGRVARPWPHDEDLHHSSWLTEEAVQFVTRKRDPSMPWFLHLSYWAPHPPLVPPQVYWDRYVNQPGMRSTIGQWASTREHAAGLAPDSSTGPFSEAEMRESMAGYYGLINHIDDRLLYLREMLFQRGSPRESAPTWIIFTSDHGEMLGDHHLFRKSLPYEGSAHVPFLIHGVNVDRPACRSSDGLVSLEDLLPTICELGGAEIPDGVDGRSLVPVLRGSTPMVREDLFGEHDGGFGNHFVVAGRFKYLWFTRTNEEQLFDLAADPHECNDLSGQADLLKPMRAKLAEHLKGRADVRLDPGALKPLGNAVPTVFWKS